MTLNKIHLQLFDDKPNRDLPKPKSRKVHRNLPQIRVALVNAPLTVAQFGRGTGKTRGVSAPWIYDRAKKMPRSTGFMLSLSYAHLIDTIIPELQQGWADYGLEEGVHYWVRETPPEALKIPKPYLAVDNPKYFIFWVNGSVTKLVSLDRKAMVNSKSFDYGCVFEGRKLNGQTITDDVFPTLRGGTTNLLPNGKTFGSLVEHHSKLIESDAPRDVRGRWFLNYQKEMDVETVNNILAIQKYVSTLRKAPKKNAKLIQECEDLMNEMRYDLVYYAKASSLDNIHILGIRTLKEWRKVLTDIDWNISILNEEMGEVANCFYSALDDVKHGYVDAIDYDYVDKLSGKLKHNWEWDLDIDYELPFDISMDCNAIHNCIVVGQRSEAERKFINYFSCMSEPKNPTDHKTVANMFVDYYRGCPNNKVRLIYNNTMVAGERAGLKTKADDMYELLTEEGFDVERIYVGQAMKHEDLYDQWLKLLTNELDFRFSYNRNNCEIWYDASKDTPTLVSDTKKGQQIKKDKRSEHPNSGISPIYATHPTEAGDTLLQYDLYHYSSGSTSYYGIVSA
jgi:hypothetical protein